MGFPLLAAQIQRRRFMPKWIAGANGASSLLSSESQGLAFDFTDQTALIRDTSTPANNYASAGIVSSGALVGPSGKLTYTSPSNKLTRQADGYYKYQAHNLYLNSASPANQAITVVSGASYAVTITGTVSVSASGAATGTWTAGTNTFTAATTTLTLGSTSGSGTVHVRRTPSNDDYIATAGAAKYALPIEYDTSGNCEGLLVEEQRTNLCLYSNDLTQAGSWTASNMTTAKTATGPDNVANSATTITASAGNATILQAITSASAARVTSVYIKRRTGTGNIDLTQDNGSTWTTQAVTSTWTRFSLSSVTSANPTVGIRIVTSGDAVDVAYFQHSLGSFPTSPILTYGAAATRVADNISIATSAFPEANATEHSFVIEIDDRLINTGDFRSIVCMHETGAYDDSVSIHHYDYDTRTTVVDGGVNQADIIPTDDNLGASAPGVHKVAARFKDNDVRSALDGTLSTADTTCTMPAAADMDELGFFNRVGGAYLTGILKTVKYVPRALSDAELATETA